jgi:hypothetical protein
MKIDKLVLTVLSVLITGCVSTAPQVKTENVSIPNLNVESTSFLGERLLMQATGFYGDSLQLGNADGLTTRINSGKYCQRAINSDLFYSSNSKAIGLKNGYGRVLEHQSYVEYDKKKNEVCATPVSCYNTSEITIKYTSNDFCISQNSNQKIIEYNGKAGDVLNFTYREFTEGMAKSPFTTNFTMDLSEGDLIGYKGAQIKIKKATNNQITYVVIKNFNAY